MSRYIAIAKIKDVPEGQTRAFDIEDKSIAVSCVDGTYYAFINVCSHMEFPLDDGDLQGKVIECAHHGARFDLETGDALSMPAVTPIQVFKTKVEGDSILVDLG